MAILRWQDPGCDLVQDPVTQPPILVAWARRLDAGPRLIARSQGGFRPT